MKSYSFCCGDYVFTFSRVFATLRGILHTLKGTSLFSSHILIQTTESTFTLHIHLKLAREARYSVYVETQSNTSLHSVFDSVISAAVCLDSEASINLLTAFVSYTAQYRVPAHRVKALLTDGTAFASYNSLAKFGSFQNCSF